MTASKYGVAFFGDGGWRVMHPRTRMILFICLYVMPRRVIGFACCRKASTCGLISLGDVDGQVMDPRTRMILFKLLNQGFFSQINGCLSTGKEANVYYAVGGEVSAQNKVPKRTMIRTLRAGGNVFVKTKRRPPKRSRTLQVPYESGSTA